MDNKIKPLGIALILLLFFSVFSAPTQAQPAINANNSQSLNDTNSDGVANEEEQIDYTTVISNTGTAAGINLTYTNTLDSNLTLIPGSVNVSPLAFDDNHASLGALPLNIDAATGVISNDQALDGDTLTVTAFDATSTQGGTVNVNPDGSFVYTSAPAFNGLDTFTYTISDPRGLTDTATVSINVSSTVWFIDNSAAPGGDGSFTAPFDSILAFETAAVDAPGEAIFIFEGAGTYADGLTLKDNQQLIGEGTGFPPTIPAGNPPIIEDPAGATLTLAMNNTVSGVSLSGAAGAALTCPATFGTATVSNSTITGSGTQHSISLANCNGMLVTANSNISNTGQGSAININGGSPVVTLNNSSVATTGVGPGLMVANPTGGSFTTTGTSTIDVMNFGTAGSGGIDIDTSGNPFSINIASANINLTGPLTIGAGFANLPAASTVNFGSLTINGTGGTQAGIAINGSAATFTLPALNISNLGGGLMTVGNGAANVTFGGNLSQASGSHVLATNSHTGTITQQTGTISATNGTGLQFNNADGTYDFQATVNLNGGDAGIDILSGSNGTFTFSNSTSITDPSGVAFDLDTGTAAITYNGTITQNNPATAVEVTNTTAGPVSFNGLVTANTGGARGIFLNSNTGNVISFANVDIDNTGSNGFQADGGGTVNVTTGSVSSGRTAILFSNVTTNTTFSSLTSNNAINSGVALSNLGAGSVFNGGTTNISGANLSSILVSNIGSGSDIDFGTTTINNRVDIGIEITSVSNGGGAVNFGPTTINNQLSQNEQSVAISNNAASISFANLNIDGNGVSSTAVSALNNTGSINFGAGLIANSGEAFNIFGGTSDITYSGDITHSRNNTAIVLQNHSVGTVTFQTGTLNVTNGSGIRIENADGTYNFNGTTNLSGGDARVSISLSDGTFNFSSNTSITNPINEGLRIVGGSASLTYSGDLTKGAGTGPAVFIQGGHNTGTVTFNSGTLSATTGVGLQFDNADGTYNFNGATTLNGGDAGIDILNGSDGTFSFSSATSITNPAGVAFNLDSGTAPVNYSGNITSGQVNISNHSVGTLTFDTGTINTSSIILSGTTSAINFNGTTNVTAVGSTSALTLNGFTGTANFANTSSIVGANNSAINVLNSSCSLNHNGSVTQNNPSSALLVAADAGSSLIFGGPFVANTSMADAIVVPASVAPLTLFLTNLDIDTTIGDAIDIDGSVGSHVLEIVGAGNSINVVGNGKILNLNGVAIGGNGLNLAVANRTGTGATSPAIDLNNIGAVSLGGINIASSNIAGPGIEITGNQLETINFTDLDIALDADNQTALNLAGATLGALFTATDFDITATSGVNTVGVNLSGTTGSGILTLGDSVVAGGDATIAGTGGNPGGPTSGVVFDATTDLSFVFGDGEEATDTGSSITAVTTIDGTLPTNGSYNFLDVGTLMGSNSVLDPGPSVFFVDQNQNAANDGSSVAQAGSIANAEASSADVIILVDTDLDGIIDPISTGSSPLDLDDGQAVISFDSTSSPIDVGEFGITAPTPPASFMLASSFILGSTVIPVPAGLDSRKPQLENAGGVNGVEFSGGSGAVAGLSIHVPGGNVGINSSNGSSGDIFIKDTTSFAFASGVSIFSPAGAKSLTIDGLTSDTVNSTSAAVSITGAGVTVRELSDVTISGSGLGLEIASVTFDSDPLTIGDQIVSGGNFFMDNLLPIGIEARGIQILDSSGQLRFDSVNINNRNHPAINIANITPGQFVFEILGGVIRNDGADAILVNRVQANISLTEVVIDFPSSSSGINLSNLDPNSSFEVTGNTTILNRSSSSIRITNAGAGLDVDFGPVSITNQAGSQPVINIDTVAGGTIDFNGLVNIPFIPSGPSIRLDNVAADTTFANVSLTPLNSDGIEINNQQGDVTISGGTIQIFGTGVGIDRNANSVFAGTTALNINNVDITYDAGAPSNGNQVNISTAGSETLNLTFDNNMLDDTATAGTAIGLLIDSVGTSILNANASGNTIRNFHGPLLGAGINLFTTGTPTLTLDLISGNSVTTNFIGVQLDNFGGTLTYLEAGAPPVPPTGPTAQVFGNTTADIQ